MPAFQDLARQIGAERMQIWIDRIGFGDRNTSAGVDVFWLPAKGRSNVMSKDAQAIVEGVLKQENLP